MQIHFITPSPFLLVQVSVRARMRAVIVASSQCSCGGEDDVVPELNFEELQSAFTGYTLPYLSRPLICCFVFESLPSLGNWTCRLHLDLVRVKVVLVVPTRVSQEWQEASRGYLDKQCHIEKSLK
ncbi:hypothetical protein L1049_021955 [Liquidambar formosana]|uniref:Uncharacterized protein n=1 Tax=Liquidambar formosana TaxID=63359 RepID=A0AAP0WNK3_LIQFO